MDMKTDELWMWRQMDTDMERDRYRYGYGDSYRSGYLDG